MRLRSTYWREAARGVWDEMDPFIADMVCVFRRASTIGYQAYVRQVLFIFGHVIQACVGQLTRQNRTRCE